MSTLTRITKENLHEIHGATYFEIKEGNKTIRGNELKIARYLQKKYDIEINLFLDCGKENGVDILIDGVLTHSAIDSILFSQKIKLDRVCRNLIAHAVSQYNITLFAETLLTHMQHRALVMAANFQNLSKELRDAAKLNEVEEINAVIENCLAHTGDD